MKMKAHLPILIIALLVFSCSKDDDNTPPPDSPVEGPVAVEKSNPTKLYVHYMPWFESPETSDNGGWGIHWTMANKNPDKIDATGKREIASHFYPIIGPYASSDKDVIEYHLLLMKYAGIDGIIIDWYGSFDVYDFPDNMRNAETIIDELDNVGLSFALTYEDWTVNSVVDQGKAPTAVDAAIADFEYIEQNYFSLESYIEIDNKPLLTVFGPQAIENENDWTTVLNSISDDPTFLSLWYESGDLGGNASGEFSWVYQDNTHITNFYDNRKDDLEIALGSAYPGFKDYYDEGDWSGATDWIIEHNNGATFDATLAMASNANVKYLQLVTWNDFGEGTIIEPTLEFEYLYLEKLQEFSGVKYSIDELEYIEKLYFLRKSKANDSMAQEQLNKAFNHLVKLEVEDAKTIIDTFQ